MLGIDYHHRLSVAEAASFCQRMPAGTLDFLEEPIRDETPEAYESLRTMTTVPFAIGEEFASKWQFLPYIERGITNYARIDVCNVGGLTESLKVAGWCEAHYIDLMPHNPLGPICTAATVHFAAAAPNFAWLEMRSYVDGGEFVRTCPAPCDVKLQVEGREARVFSDRTASPSYVIDVAAATKALVERGAPGLYHAVGTGRCTWQELGIEAAKLLGREHDARLIPVLAADVPLRATRPKYAALSNAKLTAVVPMPLWRDALSRYIETRRSTKIHAAPTTPL
jgi:hypothetical protein